MKRFMQGCILSSILFKLHSEMLIREAIEGLREGVTVGGKLEEVQSFRCKQDIRARIGIAKTIFLSLFVFDWKIRNVFSCTIIYKCLFVATSL